MPRAKSVKPEVAPKTEADLKQITIDKAEFVRTRDALVTSWITLQNALKNATSAYIDHSNAVLGGTVDLDPSQMDLGAFLQSGDLVTVGGGAPAAPEKKTRKKAEPRDPNQPKRPLTAYLLWLGENREKIHSELGPEQKRGEISSEGTKRWKMLPEEVKQKYKDAYQASREIYNKEFADFKANGAPVAADSPDAEEDVEAEEEAAPAAAGADSDDESDDDSTSDEEEAPPKEPTPPPVKTPKSALKGGRKKAAPPASSPPLPASSPVKKGAFTAVNGSNKRKSKTTDAEAVAEEPKKKRGRKAKEEEVAVPASTPAEPPASAKKEKKEKKKGRKSVGGEA
ncbi:hypothetical protein AUEXF2481DRAFT_4561 [Aureobasidium subglaciale EXF-2481]|uniref:HMG box domain-containing protein n=1 Tax=Aureobasidium subglaciale (strain EXF-2481) TaxID=1043005 RepID=A0A074YNC2_AURSE|nr:uncharacterized protein AUEXF2481DRAFT_4561 [Aureobasidium subglaciale EXF-2481]KAI5195726.1 hypothetical protein E4T38_08892 [Aureobasidium subglaciale]KAI5214667.1 hypothetical protein E4T40_08862 [Aureobasidium subglaciale]KAI5217599.1 hypothetical protein E4T41_08759 [Aureobasidium subglaciale]KAI5255154.1 hypothetical protein E4T46_08806 [Aureobasidium subglaciale]KEQ95587.1 hypothetical protein AUEXF2481DRAFT_4561 [Aureobasidium subglaciale EXF-2481]